MKLETIKVKDLLEADGLFTCPHCWNRNRIMAFTSYTDLKRHVQHGCHSYRYRGI